MHWFSQISADSWYPSLLQQVGYFSFFSICPCEIFSMTINLWDHFLSFLPWNISGGRTIIFTETRGYASELAGILPGARALHGEIQQSQREVKFCLKYVMYSGVLSFAIFPTLFLVTLLLLRGYLCQKRKKKKRLRVSPDVITFCCRWLKV